MSQPEPSPTSTPTEYRSSPSSPIASSKQSALLHRLRTSTRDLFPRERRSFIADTTSASKKRAIISIAIRKGLFVFFSVHGVVSTALLALALVRTGRVKHHAYSVHRPGQQRAGSRLIQVLLQTLRSSSTARLASWLGLYSSLWTLTYSFLRKSQHKYSEWNAFIAGSLCGVSFFAQPKADRKEIAPNVLCRGLYSILMCYPLCHFKHADLLLFALSNAQIAIGYLLYPTSLPAWYVHWISRVGELNPRYVDLNRRLDRSLMPSNSNLLQDHHRLLSRDSHPRTWLNENRIQSWLNQPDPTLRMGAPCALNHFRHNSCLAFNLHQLLKTILKMAPTYAILHLVPALIFRSKLLVKSPITFMSSIIKKTTSSALFLGTFVSVVQNCFCLPSQVYERFGIVLRGAPFYGLMGFCTGVSLLWEEPKRRGELALYCAPKALYSLWAVLKAKKWVPREIPMGDIIVSSVGCGMLMHCFMNRKERMPALARGIISQIVDPHTPDRTKKLNPLLKKSDDPPPDQLPDSKHT
ncbi:hypothetical protein PTTG_00362 [Puccinia triticina 1-1 BBBD Race 1]|uniref:Transmembrane protein 135 N-terminal domain-containing protein n=2 Tax=Puccinia triticina TaxID=208348 RepID=A0A180GZP0_PUCT1|nr:uncharacterized protein PtA15_8A453 [Puccinia triticina]OAV98316.1 hypothetical protein PTTG_00362 [Puccinia triticina 1-1 BBBD Race 1]WAQ87549.1 hypothetical protein PtA15_8A453 [Puccinia triticina]WAR57398.1 hypothetical protein PtB15_8B445 [Puccinia triticina]